MGRGWTACTVFASFLVVLSAWRAERCVRSRSVPFFRRLCGSSHIRFRCKTRALVKHYKRDSSKRPHTQYAVMCGAVNYEGNEDQDLGASSPGSIKGSLCFILDNEVSNGKRIISSDQLDEVDEPTAAKRKRPLVSAFTISSLLAPLDAKEARNACVTIPPLERKASKYCIIEGCFSRAKHARRCWKHGGSVKCKTAGCQNRAKTKGVCWSHGGGTICRSDQCLTIAVSNGVCWAHGGGKRCATSGCFRPAFERTGNMCSIHYNLASSHV